jgi:hypothetical protein
MGSPLGPEVSDGAVVSTGAVVSVAAAVVLGVATAVVVAPSPPAQAATTSANAIAAERNVIVLTLSPF